jgi:hypothetical protein
MICRAIALLAVRGPSKAARPPLKPGRAPPGRWVPMTAKVRARQSSNRIEQFQPVPKCCDAKLLQVLMRQARKNRLIYLVFAECRLLPEAQAPRPHHDAHDGPQLSVCGLSSCRARGSVTSMPCALCPGVKWCRRLLSHYLMEIHVALFSCRRRRPTDCQLRLPMPQ